MSFKDGVIEQQTKKMKLLNAVKAKDKKDARAWLDYLNFSKEIIDTGTATQRVKIAKEWPNLAKLYASAISSLKGTDQSDDLFRIRIGLATATGCVDVMCAQQSVAIRAVSLSGHSCILVFRRYFESDKARVMFDQLNSECTPHLRAELDAAMGAFGPAPTTASVPALVLPPEPELPPVSVSELTPVAKSAPAPVPLSEPAAPAPTVAPVAAPAPAASKTAATSSAAAPGRSLFLKPSLGGLKSFGKALRVPVQMAPRCESIPEDGADSATITQPLATAVAKTPVDKTEPLASAAPKPAHGDTADSATVTQPLAQALSAAAGSAPKSTPVEKREPMVSMMPRPVPTEGAYFTVCNKHYRKLNEIGKGGSSKVYKVRHRAAFVLLSCCFRAAFVLPWDDAFFCEGVIVSCCRELEVDGVTLSSAALLVCPPEQVLSEDSQIYALKRIKLGRIDPSTMQSYQNEIEILASLQNEPNIIRMIDSEVDLVEKNIMVVMEYGEIALSSWLQRQQDKQRPHLDANMLRMIWQQMLKAVQTIHDARIVHGDLKSANFVFVEGTLKLIDFGIAKAIGNDTTNIVRDSQVGTINYMAPEALSGSAAAGGRLKLARASDIWSLGCILYQMVYGSTPFAGAYTAAEGPAPLIPRWS